MSNKFVFICPTYNASKTCRQTILSIAAQSYENWRVILVNDMSTDDTEEKAKGLFEALGLSEKLTFVQNTEKKWEIENMLTGLSMCDDSDIVCRLDMDDFLIDNNILEIINMAYQNTPELDVVWTNQRWFDDKRLTNMNISAALPPGADPYKHPWVSSHFKTFRKGLLTGVNDANYRGADGKYFKRIGDQTFMLPALHNARKWLHIPIAAYAYRCNLDPETFQTDDAKFQAAEAQFLRERGFVK